MDKSEIHQRYLKVHNSKIDKHGFTPKALWGSKESQILRFKKLSELFLIKNKISILDVGCGMCDFYAYLQKNGYKEIKYTGLEINPQFCQISRNRFPNLDIRLGSLDIIKDNEKWDYVVASGIYNLGISSKLVSEVFINEFKSIYNQINVGFAVNFLSKFSDNPDEISIYHEPLFILDLIFKNFSKYVKFDQTYLPNDFTIFVYKNKNDNL